ncbi:putative polyprotein [Penaeus vannamei]|uniref:Putative polyprotein n=1 Tax=Penaeus vannamei TaxID=6689 RepID=A0A3R7MEF2_PENVA|nr:putative polyprotein [Penaeus vannamei]
MFPVSKERTSASRMPNPKGRREIIGFKKRSQAVQDGRQHGVEEGRHQRMEETVDYRIPMLGPPPPEYMMTEVFVPQNDRSFVAVWDSGAKPNLVKLSLYRAHEDVKKKDSTRQRDVPSPLVPHNVTVHDIAGVVDQPINANCGDAPMTCSSDVAFNSVADKEDTVVIVSTGVYTLPAGKASIILGSLKQKDERLKNGTSILISGLPLGENCIVIPVVAKAEDVVKVLVCNFGRTPFLVHSKRTIANAVSIQDDEEEQLGRLPTDHWEKQRVLTRMSINAVVTEVKPDDVEEEDPLDQALQIDPCCVVKNGPVYDEKRFQKLLKALDADRWILKEDQRKAAESMIWEFQEAFNLKEEPLGRTNLVEHKIETGDSDRVYVPPRFIPYALRPAVEAEVQALKEQGHIRVSSSEWNAPIVLVKRKDKSHPRLCVDYRALNSQTKLEFYPLPLIEDILYQVSQSKWFSTLDLRSGYHQVPLDDDSIPKSAFTTHEGHFEYTVMPFGLSNAPRTFQRLMNRVFSGQIGQGLQLFLDDIAIYTDDIDRHLQVLKEALEKQPFIWGSEQEEAFEVLKRSLLKEPVLRSPDFSRTWYISTDASKGAIGAILAQRYDGHFCPVSYFSRQLRGAELRYDVMEKEALAVIEALKKFKPLIWGLEVIVMSDNRSLQWLFHKAKDGNARVTRWALTAQSFGAKILYHPGKLNAAADALSRIEAPEGVDPEDIEKASTMIIDEAQNCRILMAVVANNRRENKTR